MQASTTIRILVFVALICFPAIAAAQQEKPVGQSAITGRVVFADTGRPVRRAVLKLHSSMKGRATATTAANIRGEFRFSEVVAGSYFVVAEAPGVLFPRSAYAVNEFGMGTDADIEQTKVSVDGKNSVRCEVRVARAGTIRGTITYADKEPVVGGRIALFRRKEGVLMPFFSEIETTNDRGMYRIDGLPNGEYFVGVAVGRLPVALVRTSDEGRLPTAYYPGVGNISEAKAIQIESGSEVTGINITLADEPPRQISGVVKWRRNGTIARGASLMLRRKDEPALDLSLGTLYESMAHEDEDGQLFSRDFGAVMKSFPPLVDVDKEGKWTFTDVTPGTYVITAFGVPPKEQPQNGDGEVIDESNAGFSRDPARMVSQKIELTIEDKDLEDVTIELPIGNRILGTVTVEGSDPVRVAIMVNQRGGNEVLMSVARSSNPDGTFLLEGIPNGEVILDADVSGFRDSYVKSITRGGQDLLREPLVVTEGAEVTGVSITIGQGMAVLTGRVQFKDDESAAAGAGVLLVKTDSKLWHLRSSRRFAMTNAAGEFKLSCAPGEYLVFTWPAGAQPLQSIEEFVRMHASTARTILLQSKEEKRVDLTVNSPRK